MADATLDISIDPTKDRAIFQQIADEIERLILIGVLRSGSFIPSVRELAVMLSVNPNTVAKACTHLQNRKVVEFVRGMGLRVCVREHTEDSHRRVSIIEERVKDLLSESHRLGFRTKEIIRLIEKHGKETSR